MNAMDAALISRALGDTNRLQIMQMLSGGEKCACKLLERFEITQPTLSHHMKILSECGLVQVRREGKWCHYSVNQKMVDDFARFIHELSGKEGEREGGCCGQ